MKDIKFSFIVPNYNKGEYINECLNSIFAQTYKNFEVIVIDDGSTDNSLEEINKFLPVTLLTTDRLQAGGARNKGLSVAKGDYIIFLDSDDYLISNDILDKLAKKINGEDIIFLNFTKIRLDLTTREMVDVKGNIAEKIENTEFLGVPTKCFKRELIKDIKFPEKKRYEDICFTLESLCKAQSYTSLEVPFFVYRIVLNSNVTSPVTESTMLDIYDEYLKMYRLIVKYPKYKNELLSRIKKGKLNLRLEVLDKLIETGENIYRDYF